VTDIFREVEEDVRRERFAKLWKEYGDYAIALVAVIVIAVMGYQLWQRYESGQRLKASAAFNAAEQMAETGNSAVAAQSFAQLAKDSPGGYAAVAHLAEADALLASGNRSEALALYESIAAKDDALLGAVARIRAGWASVETAPQSDLQTLLAPLTDPTSPWRYVAREILAYSDYHAGRTQQAQREFQALGAQSDAPAGLRSRAQAMASLIKTGGEKDEGTVPPPPKRVPDAEANAPANAAKGAAPK
jgi:hypothetical protein